MSRLILHIGMTKTGSSAIFSFLFKNAGLLEAQGTVLPILSAGSAFWPDRRNASFIHALLDEGELPENEMQAVEACLVELAGYARNYETVILRDELMWFCRGDFWLQAAALARDAGFERLSVILYLRRPDMHLASEWKQRCQGGAPPMSFEEFCEIRATNDCYDYEALVEAIERGLPPEDILLRAYDRERLAGGDLFQDVCEAAGITWNQDFTRPVRGTNPSVSYDVAEALRRLRLEGTTVRIGAFRHLFSAWHPDPPGMTPFTPDAARAFSERYIDGYQRLSERYFDGEPLFSSDYDHPIWVPNEDRIASYRRWILRTHRLLSLPVRFARKIRKADKRG